MINKKLVQKIVVLVLIALGWRIITYSDLNLGHQLILDEDMGPLLIMDRDNEEIVMHFFQREDEDKRIKLPKELGIWPYGGYDFDKNKNEICILCSV